MSLMQLIYVLQNMEYHTVLTAKDMRSPQMWIKVEPSTLQISN